MLHLIHPALVHFAVAFLIAGAVCECWGLAARRESVVEWGSRVLLFGLGSSLLAVVSGYLAANTAEFPMSAQDLLVAHERTGLVLLAAVLISQFWKAWTGGKIQGGGRWFYMFLLLLVVALTIYSALLGGRMVYGHGVGVVAG